MNYLNADDAVGMFQPYLAASSRVPTVTAAHITVAVLSAPPAVTTLTVADTVSTSAGGPRLVFSVPPLTTTAHEQPQHAHYHCSPSDPDSSIITVIEYPTSDASATSIGTLTTIAHLPRLATDQPSDETPQTPAEVATNE